MKRHSDTFCMNNEIEWEELGEGVSRQIMGWDNQMMMVKVRLEKGAEGRAHSHFHAQTTYVASGVFEFTIGNETRKIKQGDALRIEPNIVHSVIALEEGILVDVFNPVREDFLDGSKPAYLGK